jgi:hypothetical protein
MRYPYVGPFRPETKYRCGLGQGSCIPLTWERSSIKVCWRPLRSAGRMGARFGLGHPDLHPHNGRRQSNLTTQATRPAFFGIQRCPRLRGATIMVRCASVVVPLLLPLRDVRRSVPGRSAD